MRLGTISLIGACWFASVAFVLAADEKPKRPAKRPDRPDPARMLERFDKNKDGFLDRTECPKPLQTRFDRLDRDKDGKLSRDELQQAAKRLGTQQPGSSPDRLFRLLDTNQDGKLSKEELKQATQLLEKFDNDKDGLLESGELPMPGGRPGEIITPAAKGERHPDKLKVGDLAPDFTLPDPTGKTRVTLSSFRGKKLVVLIFASYT